jgi:hypothetical protein
MDSTKSVSASSQDTVNNLGMGEKGFYGLSPSGLVIETECRYEAQDTQRRPGGGEHRKTEPGPFDSLRFDMEPNVAIACFAEETFCDRVNQ